MHADQSLHTRIAHQESRTYAPHHHSLTALPGQRILDFVDCHQKAEAVSNPASQQESAAGAAVPAELVAAPSPAAAACAQSTLEDLTDSDADQPEKIFAAENGLLHLRLVQLSILQGLASTTLKGLRCQSCLDCFCHLRILFNCLSVPFHFQIRLPTSGGRFLMTREGRWGVGIGRMGCM